MYRLTLVYLLIVRAYSLKRNLTVTEAYKCTLFVLFEQADYVITRIQDLIV